MQILYYTIYETSLHSFFVGTFLTCSSIKYFHKHASTVLTLRMWLPIVMQNSIVPPNMWRTRFAALSEPCYCPHTYPLDSWLLLPWKYYQKGWSDANNPLHFCSASYIAANNNNHKCSAVFGGEHVICRAIYFS